MGKSLKISVVHTSLVLLVSVIYTTAHSYGQLPDTIDSVASYLVSSILLYGFAILIVDKPDTPLVVHSDTQSLLRLQAEGRAIRQQSGDKPIVYRLGGRLSSDSDLQGREIDIPLASLADYAVLQGNHRINVAIDHAIKSGSTSIKAFDITDIETPEDTERIIARGRGFTARKEGYDIECNPYEISDERHRLWTSGWLMPQDGNNKNRQI